MAAHTLFFVHGMGKHDKGFSDKAAGMLKGVSRQYSFFRQAAFEEYFAIREILHDDILDHYREMWKGNAEALLATLPAETGNKTADMIRSMLKKYDDALGDNSFATHWLDVLTYRTLAQARDAVNVRVAEGILSGLPNENTSFLPWSILGHSLGTAVVHNTLCSMFGEGEPSNNVRRLNVEDFRPTCVVMAANVSRLLQIEEPECMKVYNSIVRPGSPGSRAVCDYYLNLRHKYDPFTKPKPFDHDFDDRFPAGRYFDLRPAHLNQINTHDLVHYLAAPMVHIPFLRCCFGEGCVTKEEEKASSELFEKETLNSKISEYRKELEGVFPKELDDWKALAKLILAFKKFVKP
jgi:hypothetical protein